MLPPCSLEKWTEDEMVGWHHWFNGSESERAWGASKAQGSLVCCSPRGHRKLDMTEWLSSNDRTTSEAWPPRFGFNPLIPQRPLKSLRCSLVQRMEDVRNRPGPRLYELDSQRLSVSEPRTRALRELTAQQVLPVHCTVTASCFTSLQRGKMGIPGIRWHK